MSWEVIQGDCIERMAEMEEASVDAVVCDPPYGISFMGSAWDTFNPDDMEQRVARRTSNEGREVEDVLQLHAKSTRAAKEHTERGQGDLLALTIEDVISDIEQEEVTSLDG